MENQLDLNFVVIFFIGLQSLSFSTFSDSFKTIIISIAYKQDICFRLIFARSFQINILCTYMKTLHAEKKSFGGDRSIFKYLLNSPLEL